MTATDLGPTHATHEVLNQPPPLDGYNLFTQDRALVDALRREGAEWAESHVTAFGEVVAGEPMPWGVQANGFPPVLRTYDRYGPRIDEVEYHPAWHELMRLSVRNGLHALPWREPRRGAHVARVVRAPPSACLGVPARKGCCRARSSTETARSAGIRCRGRGRGRPPPCRRCRWRRS